MALRRIVLRDFVIVAALEVDLHAGFTVLTGETGAGKSILIDALQLALGARADSAVVREGARQADLCAEFDCPAHLHDWLHAGGFESDAATLLVRRVIDTQGKSRAWINGAPATATQLRALGEHLLDIHGQHAWQSLTRADAVRALLDAYAGADSTALRPHWQAWRAAQNALQHALQQQESLQAERERLLWQLSEMEKLAPLPGEWDELNTQHTQLAHAQALLDSAHSALHALEDEHHGASTSLVQAQRLLEQQAHLAAPLQQAAQGLGACLQQVAEVRRALHSFVRHTHLDPTRLEQLDARLGHWLGLARRYKRPPADLPLLRTQWQAQLQQLNASADIAALHAQEQLCAQAYAAAAQALRAQRLQAAPRLASAITQAMQELGMAGGRFEVHLEHAREPGVQGLDEVLFLVAGHPAATPRPIGKVASGGELSRISLAIAVTTSALGTAPTLIFDEVDAGVGGAVAQSVGRLMHQLGQDRQVLAVTHLPQVAACADQHLLVSKQRSKAHTRSRVQPLAAPERVHEIARMLGGHTLSDTSLAHAREMLAAAHPT